VHTLRRRADLALPLLERALAGFDALDARRWQARVLEEIGTACAAQRRFAEAIERVRAAAAIYADLGMPLAAPGQRPRQELHGGAGTRRRAGLIGVGRGRCGRLRRLGGVAGLATGRWLVRIGAPGERGDQDASDGGSDDDDGERVTGHIQCDAATAAPVPCPYACIVIRPATTALRVEAAPR
jgi:hypothetical protein